MDYRELLRRYMALVADHEGVSLLDYNPGFDINLTAAEMTELRKIESEL